MNETYRFGYNDKEFDREWMKYDYGFRMYDPLLCRFLNVDPLARAFLELTPFQYASNDPILNIDLDGLEGTPAKENTDNFTYSTAREYTFDRYSSHLLPLTTNNSAANSTTYVAASKYIPKQTFVGPSNPQGYNQDYLNQQQTQRYFTALKENYIQQGQNIDPICFGGPGLGAYGTNQGIPDAIREAPFIVFPELALDKLQELRTLSKLKAIAEVTSKDGVANQVHWGCEFLEANQRMIELPMPGEVYVEAEKVLATASKQYKGTTVLGNALSKHAGRKPNIWGKLKGNISTYHDQALKHFDDIMDSPGFFSEEINKDGIHFLEKRLPDGRGMRLNMDKTFKGFID